MATTEDTYTFYDGSKVTVLKRPAGPTDGIVMEFRMKSEGAHPPPHLHPTSEEITECLEGECEFLIDETWRPFRPGDKVTLRPGQRHTFRNNSGNDVLMRMSLTPHRDFERYIRTLAELSNELEVAVPHTPPAMMRWAMVIDRHRDLMRPADAPLKVGLKVASSVGRFARVKVPS